jgi:hypothetical protein
MGRKDMSGTAYEKGGVASLLGAWGSWVKRFIEPMDQVILIQEGKNMSEEILRNHILP